MIFETPVLTGEEIQVIAKIDEIRQGLSYALRSSPKKWTGLLARNLTARAIQGSNSIEGYNVTFDEAVAVVEREEIEAKPDTRFALVGYQFAMSFILRLAEDPFIDLNEELLRSIHYMMISYDHEKNPGKWRPGHIYVRNDATGKIVYEGPDAELVPQLMKELAESIGRPDASVPVLIRAAMAHLNLAMIHPFSDGNGRMARALQTLVLAKDGTIAPPFSSIEEYVGRVREPYYAVLAKVGEGKWNPTRDARPWILFCLEAHLEQAIIVARRVRETSKLWDELEAELVVRKLDTRMISALYEASIGLTVRANRYRMAADVSPQVASRDLRALVDEQLLIPIGEKKGRRYEASPILKEIRARTREPRVSAAEMFADQLVLPF